jgi:hypothetical protein
MRVCAVFNLEVNFLIGFHFSNVGEGKKDEKHLSISIDNDGGGVINGMVKWCGVVVVVGY